jgi:hypothetical protein
LPSLDKFSQQESGQATVLVVMQPKDKGAMLKELADGGYSVPALVDGAGVAKEFGVRYVPTLVVLDREGQPFQTVSGPVDLLRLSRLLDDVTG